MGGSRLAVISIFLLGLSGCAVVKTTDITDASYKRHQSIAVLGWPLYTRVTDQERGATAQLVTSREDGDRDARVRAAELLGRQLEFDE